METTSFEKVYKSFLEKITDNLYLELSEEETKADCESLLLAAIPDFEFPRKNLFDYTLVENGTGYFNIELTEEEINILAFIMKINWLNRQIDSVELTRQRYSGSDFKMTSQANHLSKLITSKKESKIDLQHLQRLYKRRVIDERNKTYTSNWGIFKRSVFD